MLHWTNEHEGRRRQWRARITEQVPNARISWQSEHAPMCSSTVSFSTVGPERTLVRWVMDYVPRGPSEAVGDWMGAVSRRMEGDLTRFRQWIEQAGEEFGTWRGGVGLLSVNQPMRQAS
jgi:uncharacterized membrane protein